MPWNKDEGGGGQGPWGQGPNGGNRDNPRNRNNWGGRNNGPGNLPPELEDIIQRSKDQFRNAIPGGGRFSWLIPVILVIAVVIYNSIYQIQPDERGVVLRLGSYARTVDPGLEFALWPIEHIEKPRVGTVRQINIGTEQRDSQMLTGDKNIISVPFTLQWRISNPKDFLFNIANQEATIRALAQSAMREVVAQNSAQAVLTTKKSEIAAQVSTITQGLLDEYQAGVTITALNLGETQPPAEVADAFADVVRAEQNRRQLENEAQQYRNQKNQQAEGEVGRLIENATGDKAAAIAEAKGETARFLAVYEQYKQAKDVTRRRLFLETMENVLSQSNKVVIEQGKNGTGVVPYLPLPQIQPKAN
ncbi:FtsH protease activity modulator HflK [Aestuariivirga sp.]|uniref:FtsH protease activity modulator HflK n=1 Tax=Aestuariivirga sp. TaxID=2650926 RepID=UPI0039E25AAD